MNTIQIIIKSAYGKDLIYPLTHQKELEALTRQKTLSRAQIQALKDMGFKIEVIPTKL